MNTNSCRRNNASDDSTSATLPTSQTYYQYPSTLVLNIPIVQTTWSFGIMYISDSAIAACGPGHLTTQA